MRDKDIVSALKHVEVRRQELLSLMFDSKFKKSSLDNISNLVADILGNTTKCFDYCANDIFEKYVSSKTISTKKVKIYFPFYKAQLENKSNPFSILKTRKKVLYDFLYEIADRSDQKVFIENTRIPFSVAREVRDLVNSDKHNKIIEVDNQGRSELLAVSKIGNISIPESQLNQGGWHAEVFPGQKKKTVISKSYRLTENNEDVADFCSNSQWNAQQLLNKIYRKFFSSKII